MSRHSDSGAAHGAHARVSAVVSDSDVNDSDRASCASASAGLGGSFAPASGNGGARPHQADGASRKPQRALWGSTLAYKLVRAILVLGLVVGVGIMLYPAAQRLQFAYQTVRESIEYQEALDALDPADVEAEWILAQEYNRAQAYNRAHDVNEIIDPFVDDPQIKSLNEEYWSLVNPLGNGMMGYLDIPKIGQRLGIYHGTDDDALLKGAGHIQGTSLPVGGQSTHCVLSGHRGLAGAKVFTDLDRMKVGDLVYIHVLNHDLAYEVDQILTVLPEEVSAVDIVQGEDLMTLVTCTPYAVNTHRLLVRGHRVPYVEPDMPGIDWLAWLTPERIAAIAAIVIVLIGVVVYLRRRRRRT